MSINPFSLVNFVHHQSTLPLRSAPTIFLSLIALIAPTSIAAKEQRPNVVLILADDLGWSDTTLFGTTTLYRTPNLQRLAARGMTFTRAYSSSPLCSPTRASVLTGLSPARHGITSPTCHLPTVTLQAKATTSGAPNQKATIPTSISRLDSDYYTLAEMLRDNGYATGHFGKWHLGREPYSPLEHGFQIDVPHHPGPGPAGSYVAPWKFKDFDHDPNIPDEHIEDRMAKEAVSFMEKHQTSPFFLNYWMFSVHAPFDAKQDLIESYLGRIDANDPQRSPTYAAMIESMDDAVGTLLDTLDRLNLSDNTIVIFASDNGGNMYNYVDGGTATSNSPLRGGKATMYEGGIRGPAVVVFPDTVAEESNSDEIIQSIDFYPTLLDLLEINARPGQRFDGISIVPALKGKRLKREGIYTYFPHAPNVPEWLPPSVSVHSGDWKLIRIFFGGSDGQHRYKLFNLSDDLGEQHNLASQHPERAKALDQLIENHLNNTDAVRPLSNPNFDPARYDKALEGKAFLKGDPNAPSKTPTAKRRKPVAGWHSGGTATLSLSNGVLQLKSSGKDPHFSCTLKNHVPAGPMTLHLTMATKSSGNGQLFWKPANQPFAADRRTSFDVIHDGKEHHYAIPFAPKDLTQSIRIDPTNARGLIRISTIRLEDGSGQTIQSWSF